MGSEKYVELVKNLNWSLPKWKSNAVEGIETQLDMKRGDPEAVKMFSDMYPGYDRLIEVSARMANKDLEGIDAYNLLNLCYRNETVWQFLSIGYQMIYQEKLPEPSMSIIADFL